MTEDPTAASARDVFAVAYLPVPGLGTWIVYSFLLPAGPLLVACGISIGSSAMVVLGLALAVAAFWWWRLIIRGAAQRYDDGRPTVAITDVRFRTGYTAISDEGGPGMFRNDAWEVYFADGVKVRYLSTPGLRAALAARCPGAVELRD